MPSPPNVNRMQPYPVQRYNTASRSTSPGNINRVDNGYAKQLLQSPPVDANSQRSRNSSPLENSSVSSPNNSRNTSVSPPCKNTSLTGSSSTSSVSPSCERNQQSQPDLSAVLCQEKTTYNTLAAVTPMGMLSDEYPIPPLTPISINQPYDLFEDYNATYSVL